MVHAKIQELKENQTLEIKKELCARCEIEKSILGHIQWRQELDLPVEQLTPIARNLELELGLFKARRMRNYQISQVQEQILLNQQIYIDNETMQVSTLLGIQSQPREDHESLQLLRRIGSWVYFANIPLETIFNLQATLLMSLANRVDDVIVLVKETGISFEYLTTLPEHTRNLLLKHSSAVKSLLSDEEYTIEELLELSDIDLKTVLRHPYSENSQAILAHFSYDMNPLIP